MKQYSSIYSFNTLFAKIINAWAKARDPRSAQKAEELIQMMESLYEKDVQEGVATSQLYPLSQTYTVSFYPSVFMILPGLS